MALRGIREVTDKNKHIVLEAIFNGDFIPDHLLPVGIHRCGQQRWRAHLCTVGLKFSGPPRDNVRDACEDRRKFCEENGVNFVLYGKQTHAKGPIGSRPLVPSIFPRLSDYVSTMGRTSGGSAGNSHMILTGLKTNAAMKPFFDAIENAKRVIEARKAEDEDRASYMVTNSHASLHKRIVEDSIDNTFHVFNKLRTQKTNKNYSAPFRLCPIRIQCNGLVIRFVWDHLMGADDPALGVYLESILCNAQPPIHGADLDELILKIIDSEVRPQIEAFRKLNERVVELLGQYESLHSGIKLIHKQATHTVSTRKNNIAANPPNHVNQSEPIIKIALTTDLSIDWDVLTPDSVTEDFCSELENTQALIAAPDALFTIIEASHKQRTSLLHSTGVSSKKHHCPKAQPQDPFEPITDDIVLQMDLRVEDDNISEFGRCCTIISKSGYQTPSIRFRD